VLFPTQLRTQPGLQLGSVGAALGTARFARATCVAGACAAASGVQNDAEPFFSAAAAAAADAAAAAPHVIVLKEQLVPRCS